MKSEKIDTPNDDKEINNSPNNSNGSNDEKQQKDVTQLTEEEFRKSVQSTLISVNQSLAAVASEFKKLRANQNDLMEFRDALMTQMKNAQQGSTPQQNGQQSQPNGVGDTLSKDEVKGILGGLVDVGRELGIVGKDKDLSLGQFFMQMGMKQFESMSNLTDAITQSILKNGIGNTVGKEIGQNRKFIEAEVSELK